jgi:hypothetical protein
MKRQIANDFADFWHFEAPKAETFYIETSGKTKTHERIL